MNVDVVTKKLLELGELSLRFGRVDRVTFHEDGVTKESDTDHTVMLGLLACSFAASHMQDLDLGRVAQFALIHDLVEVYAGDTNTLGISEKGGESKEEKERKALLRLEQEYGDDFPWLVTTIKEYDSLATKEARDIKAFDKILPTIPQALNHGKQFTLLGKTKEELRNIHRAQLEAMSLGYASDMKEVLEVLALCMKSSEDTIV